jgi:negative regulator of sigma E activity
MSHHSLSSLMGLTTDPMTGKVIALRVCAHCERENNQASFIQSYARVMKCEAVSHGICTKHYQEQIARLTGDRTEVII